MLIRIGYDIVFGLPAPTPFILLLSVHPTRFPKLRGPEVQSIEPFVPISRYIDSFGNSCGRIIAPELGVKILDAFLAAEFEGGRHERRLEKMDTHFAAPQLRLRNVDSAVASPLWVCRTSVVVEVPN